MVICVLLVAGGCGVRTESKARLVDSDKVPFGLLDSSPSAGPTTTPPPGPLTDTFSAYFVRAGLLVPVAVEHEVPILPETALRALVDGPDADGVKRGLRTALVGERVVRSITVGGGTALVDFGEDFSVLAPREQLLAVGQLVMTLTTLRGVGSVDVRVLGKAAEVRVGDGSLEPGPVTRDDYRTLLEPG
jgi:spore germination protein GerM